MNIEEGISDRLLVGAGGSPPQPEGWGIESGLDAPAFRRGSRMAQHCLIKEQSMRVEEQR